MHTLKKTLLLIPVAVFDLQGGLNSIYDPEEPYPFDRPAFLYYLFVALRILSTLLLFPVCTLSYTLRIKRRPRTSWSPLQCSLLDFNRHIAGLADLAGLRWGVRDPFAEPSPRDLKETRFEWVEGLPWEAVTGILLDQFVGPTDAVGCFVWEREGATGESATVEQLAEGFVGIYAHGGSYRHLSAHESCPTSVIPRRLMKTGCFDSIYAAEYRLLPAPFPAALQDVAAVFLSLLERGVPSDRIVLIGDSTGGNIMLALSRWIRDEGLLKQPAGLLLLSPWSDPSYSFPTSFEFFNTRPHPEDYLSDHPLARLHIVQSLLGLHRPHSLLRHPYISPSAWPIPNESFTNFPPAFVQYGDAERLEEEVDSLVAALRKDEVAVEVEKTVDGVHDLLILPFWSSSVKEGIYSRIEGWLRALHSSGKD